MSAKHVHIAFSLAGLVLAAPLLVGDRAAAEAIGYAGYVNGCFSATTCTPTADSGTQTATFLGLTYVNAQFSGTTDITGFAALGSNSSNYPNQNLNNLGAFYLNTTAATYAGENFTLLVSFTLPGLGPQTYLAVLRGSVTSGGAGGGVTIDFNNTPIDIPLSGGYTVRNFSVADVNLHQPGATDCPSGFVGSCAPVTANFTIEAPTIPEPASMTLLGTGLVGVLGALARRRRTRAA